MATAIAYDATFLKKIPGAGFEYIGSGSFTTSDTTGTVAVPFSRILSAEISSNDTSAPVAIAIGTTLSSGTLAIARAGSGTSGAGFTFRVRGI